LAPGAAGLPGGAAGQARATAGRGPCNQQAQKQ
jgi:hypothetical protein